MILSAQSIRRRVQSQNLIESFCEPDRIFNMSFGLSAASYDLRIAETVSVPEHAYVLASSLEKFNFPNDLQGTLRDKSSWIRRGINVGNTQFDPGFRGYATIEIFNHSSWPIEIQVGCPIAQMIFEMLDEPTELPYKGKYQDQRKGAQFSR